VITPEVVIHGDGLEERRCDGGGSEISTGCPLDLKDLQNFWHTSNQHVAWLGSQKVCNAVDERMDLIMYSNLIMYSTTSAWWPSIS
jgi:hypothetical protein